MGIGTLVIVCLILPEIHQTVDQNVFGTQNVPIIWLASIDIVKIHVQTKSVVKMLNAMWLVIRQSVNVQEVLSVIHLYNVQSSKHHDRHLSILVFQVLAASTLFVVNKMMLAHVNVCLTTMAIRTKAVGQSVH